MSKFYIQSRDVSFVVSAVDAEGAALWLLNRVIEQHLPIEQIEQRQICNEMALALLDELAGFGEEIHVSEIGFGHEEVAVFDTLNLIEVWGSLIRAIDNLLEQLG